MLRRGAQDIALDDDSAFRKFSEQDIDSLLESSSSTTLGGGGADGGGGGGPSSFAKVAFVADGEQIDMADPDFWQKLLPMDEAHGTVVRGTFVEEAIAEGGGIDAFGRGCRRLNGEPDADWRYAPPDETAEEEARRNARRNARKKERYEDKGSSGDEAALGDWAKPVGKDGKGKDGGKDKGEKPPPRKKMSLGDGEDEETTDRKLWQGAHAEGWRVHDKGGAHYIYVTPAGERMSNRAEAFSKGGREPPTKAAGPPKDPKPPKEPKPAGGEEEGAAAEPPPLDFLLAPLIMEGGAEPPAAKPPTAAKPPGAAKGRAYPAVTLTFGGERHRHAP